MNIGKLRQRTTVTITAMENEEHFDLVLKRLPSPQELVAYCRKCLDAEMLELLSDEKVGELLSSFFEEPDKLFSFVDMARLAQLLADRFVVGWEGLTDDDGAAVTFSRNELNDTILPALNQSIVIGIFVAATDTETSDEAEKKISESGPST